MLPICFIALGVMASTPGGPLPAQALINRAQITTVVGMWVERPGGRRLETRITVHGQDRPLYTLFTPGEVARLPCREY